MKPADVSALPIIQTLRGADILPWLDTLADLRIRVFRDWPYLYDGSRDYERQYLEDYASSPHSVVVLALENNQALGCSTGLPLVDADPDFQQPFRAEGFDLTGIFYFGESVLDPAWRGRGLGHRFFDEREAHASELGFSITCFCAVSRPNDHPLRPNQYRSLEEFWRKRGYLPRPDLETSFSWKDIDQEVETSKPMRFWLRGG
jgi:GNAT superfamily N-acetyltransferase